MASNERQYQNVADIFANHPLMNSINFDNVLSLYEKLLKEGREMDEDFKRLFDFIAQVKSAMSNNSRRENDEDDDNNSYHEVEKNDPQFELFLKILRGHGKSYIVEGEENGVPFSLQYEGDLGKDKDCEVESRRKIRSSTRQKTRESNQNIKAIEKLPRRQLRNKSVKIKNVKMSTKKWTPDYHSFRRNLKFIENDCVLKYGDATIVYEKDGQSNPNKEEYDGGTYSDVEFLGFSGRLLNAEENNEEEYNKECSSYVAIVETSSDNGENPYFPAMNEGNASYSKDITRFRKKVIAALRKPYNQLEYDRLWQEIKFRKPKVRHLDLRNGRERPYPVNEYGKSYLDHYPDLEKQLLEVQHDRLKCLNLLRGFFFWLKQPGPLRPWDDAECLAINPGSG